MLATISHSIKKKNYSLPKRIIYIPFNYKRSPTGTSIPYTLRNLAEGSWRSFVRGKKENDRGTFGLWGDEKKISFSRGGKRLPCLRTKGRQKTNELSFLSSLDSFTRDKEHAISVQLDVELSGRMFIAVAAHTAGLRRSIREDDEGGMWTTKERVIAWGAVFRFTGNACMVST